MNGKPETDVLISHNCSDCKDLQSESVIVEENEIIEEDVDFESVDATHCVQLIQPANSRIRIQFASRHKNIKHVCVLSENRIFEIFIDDQYHSSIQGDLIDDFDDTKVYTYNIKIDKKSRHISLQIPGVQQTVWIFKIKIFLTEPCDTKRSLGNFDLNSVDHLLQDKQLSKNAEKFKDVFQMFQHSETPMSCQFSKLPASATPFSSSSLMNFDLKNKPSLESLMADPRMLSMLTASKPNYDPPPLSLADKMPSKNGDVKRDTLDPEVKEYIDQKFDQLHCDVMARLDQMEAVTNRKLDMILERLELKHVD
eukprot:TRINITY_DN22415_c0_g1_i1.p1 TRINITY_DN22415_c0_g1~~TRINITY_DN22415_c0_g1_i1.p1  ORF type:complete len:310 (-),score=38.17 TRINITY_DN22415_c0_g1_i1:98-1027(-)